MVKRPGDSGRNCAYLPVARGRLDSILKRAAGRGGMVFRVPRGYFIMNFLWTMFFAYVFIGVIAFAAGTLHFNNTDADLGALLQRPEAPYATGAALLVLLAPVLIGVVRKTRRGLPCVHVDRECRTITFGETRRRRWAKIDHEYQFTDLDEVEVLRNYETRWNARRTATRPVDSYEINLHFRPDDRWIGITESLDRQLMKAQAGKIAEMTAARLIERNVTEMAGVLKAGGDQPLGAPPFLSEEEAEIMHSLPVLEGKLRLKLFPFHFKLTDQMGQSIASLLKPLVSHLVNKVPAGKSAAALHYLCSDRDASDTDRRANVARLIDAGWRGEGEVYDVLAHVCDAGSAPVIGGNASRDLYERYYMRLADQVRNLSWKYRVMFMEQLERVVAEAPDRFDSYVLQPEKLTGIQESEAYAFKFILDVAALVIVGAAGAFSWFALRSGIKWGEPQVTVGGSVGTAVTLGLVYLWIRLRRRMGRRVRR
ncbi:MAG: hypothetical protein KOO61_02660 [Spirochaetales bacterium]|nr:hypothetical protein [Spirochaetales bacterium]